MISRYDMMKESEVIDNVDLQKYPDPLSLNYNDFTITSAPYLKRIEERYLNRFWMFVYKFFQRTELDDIILNLNNIPYRGMLEANDELYIPELNDLDNFVNEKISNGNS